MKDRIIVKRYAEGYMGFAVESLSQDRVIEEAKNFKSLLRENPDFEHFLKAFEITVSEKLKVIEKVMGADYSQEFRQFLRLLLEKGRIDKIAAIVEYIRVTYAHGIEVEALLRTSYPIDLDILQTLKERLENKLNKKFNLFLELDPDLLGGVQLIVGNTIIDGSVRKRLFELKQKLLNVRVV